VLIRRGHKFVLAQRLLRCQLRGMTWHKNLDIKHHTGKVTNLLNSENHDLFFGLVHLRWRLERRERIR
jgi:hypothetical protein